MYLAHKTIDFATKYDQELLKAFIEKRFSDIVFVKYYEKSCSPFIANEKETVVCGYYPKLIRFDGSDANTIESYVKYSNWEPEVESFDDATAIWVVCDHGAYELTLPRNFSEDTIPGEDVLPDLVESLFEGKLARGILLNQDWFYNLPYDDNTLEQLGLSATKWNAIAYHPYTSDTFILVVLLEHFKEIKSAQLRKDRLKRIQGYAVSEKADHLQNDDTPSSQPVLPRVDRSRYEQEWLFHTLNVLMSYKHLFSTPEKEDIWKQAYKYCAEGLKITNTMSSSVNTLRCAYGERAISRLFAWLCENGYIQILGDRYQETLRHFYYVVTGNDRLNGFPCEHTGERFPWRNKEKYAFVAMIKELVAPEQGQNVDWQLVETCFETNFGVPLSAEWAHNVFKSSAYKKRIRWKSQKHPEVHMIYSRLHLKE